MLKGGYEKVNASEVGRAEFVAHFSVPSDGLDYTLDWLNREDRYHKGMTHWRLKRSIVATFKQIHDGLDDALRHVASHLTCLSHCAQQVTSPSLKPSR